MSEKETHKVFQGISIRNGADSLEPQPYGEHGLGLKVCQKLLKEAGGTLECQSTPGEGTRMIMRVRAIKAKPEQETDLIDQKPDLRSPPHAA